MRDTIYFKGQEYKVEKSTNGTVSMRGVTTHAVRWFDSEAQFRSWLNR